MEFEEHMTKMEEIKLIMAEMQSKMRESLKESFNSIVQEFFNACPQVKMICWTQYTPHFNDGEECEFSVHEPYFVHTYEEDDLENPYNYEGEESSIQYDGFDLVEKYRGYAETSEGYRDHYLEKVRELEAQNEKFREAIPLCATMAAVIQDNEDLMKAMFQDHHAVYITRDKIVTMEYEHD